MGFKMEINFEGNNILTSFMDRFDSMTEVKVFNQILIMSDKDNLKFYSTKSNRDLIALRTELSEATVRNALVKLTKSELLIQLSKGEYRVNPKYVNLYNKKFINK